MFPLKKYTKLVKKHESKGLSHQQLLEVSLEVCNPMQADTVYDQNKVNYGRHEYLYIDTNMCSGSRGNK